MSQIALLQFNPFVAAPLHNAKRIVEFACEAQANGASLLIVPELSTTGYPPKDALFRPELMQENERALKLIAENSPLPVLVGAPIAHGQPQKNPLWNAAVLCRNGDFNVVARKSLLPNYDIFDERRYFAPHEADDGTNCFELDGVRYGVLICEDAWNDEDFWPSRRYKNDPVKTLMQHEPDLLLVIAASPFVMGKRQVREDLFCHLAHKYGRPLLMTGQVGANDQLIFDGSSFYANAKGHVLRRAQAFREEILYCPFEKARPLDEEPKGDLRSLLFAEVESALVLGIRDYVRKCGASDVVLGLSGGIDSAVVAALAVKALGPEHVTALCMPSTFSSEGSLTDAASLASNLGIRSLVVPIEPVMQVYRQSQGELYAAQSDAEEVSLADQNLQARTRAAYLMDFANRHGALLLCTSNKSELAVGYTTIYGDMAGALSPLADLYKGQVYRLARHLNQESEVIPRAILEKAPSAELRPHQLDQDSLPPYPLLDAVLERYVERNIALVDIAIDLNIELSQVKAIIAMLHRAEFKRRQAPLALMLSQRVFGDNWRWPIAALGDLL